MAIDKQAFEDCFKQWLSYKPNKRKDWPALKGIYYQELSRFSEVQLREALGRMLTKNNYFPDIAEITAEIRSVKSVDDVAGTLSKSELERAIYDHVLKADRYLDSILGARVPRPSNSRRGAGRYPTVDGQDGASCDKSVSRH
jgi:hypothetical protein